MENIVIDPAIVSELENLRKKALLLFILFIILGSLVGLGSFACILIGAIGEFPEKYIQGILVGAGFVLFLFVTPLFAFLAIHAKQRYQKAFENHFCPLFAQGHYDEFHFSFAKDLSDINKRVSLPLKEKPDDEHVSFYEGKVKGLSFFSFAYNRMKQGKGHPDSAAGRYIELTLTEPKNYEVLLSAKKSKKMLKIGPLPVAFESESIAFNERFEVSSSSHADALTLITPAFIDSVNLLSDDYGGKLSLYLKDDKVILYFDDYPSNELTLNKPITAPMLEAFQKEVLLPSAVIKALHL
jgi:hypothetical protein